MVNDPIGDFLTQIKNALKRKKDTVTVKSSKMLEAIAGILKEEGFIADYEIVENDVQNEIIVTLKYVNGDSAITEVKRVSRPGIRKYRGYRDIKPVRNGLGVAIYSTPKGVMTGAQAVKTKIGGEYICEIF